MIEAIFIIAVAMVAGGYAGYPWWIIPAGALVTAGLHLWGKTSELDHAWRHGDTIQLVGGVYVVQFLILGAMWLIGYGVADMLV